MPAPIAEVCVLALWLGAALFFAAAVAPAAFELLESSVAGVLVGRLLPAVFFAGIIAGVAVAAIELRWPRPGRRLRWGGAAIVAGACASAQLVVAPMIDRLRASAERPIAELARADARRVAFGRLHGVSVAALGVAMLGAAAVMVSAARAAATGGDERGA
jgi:hypothetical protein